MPPKKQPYVPGLHPRPDDLMVPDQEPAKKEEASAVIEDFLAGRKNPTMCLHEYCAQKKLKLDFKQEAVEYKPGMLSNLGGFGFRAMVDGLAYPQGVSSTKKEAKNEASRLALRVLCGLETYEPKTPKPELDDFRFEEVRFVSDVCEQRNLVYDKMMSKDEEGKYVCTVTVTCLDPFVVRSLNRDEAVVGAHTAALRALGAVFPAVLNDLHEPTGATASTLPVFSTTPQFTYKAGSDGVRSRIPDPSMALLREEAAYEALDTSLQSLPVDFASYEHHIAAIFAVHKHWQEFKGAGKLVAFGTGNNTIAVEALTMDGRSLVDSSCLVTARRAFKRYLAQEIIHCFSRAQDSIFERCLQDPTRLQLKEGLSFHLYLSHPLDGDYKESLATRSGFTPQQLEEIEAGAHYPTFTDDMHGQLRCKNEHGMIEMTSQTPLQTSISAVTLANEMRVMSLSDKVLRWNILGLQGAALTHVIDPVYLSSVSLGYHDNHDHGHLCRAICCRVYSELADKLPPPYIINHPALCFVLKDMKRNTRPDIAVTGDSINFNVHDTKIELTDGLSGRGHIFDHLLYTPRSPFKVSEQLVSRQCKAGQHFKWFREICSQDGGYRMRLYNQRTPAEVKMMAKDYQAAKREFRYHCLECSIGKWILAPPELDMFTH